MRARLQHAHEQGRKLAWRIQLPALTLGLGLFFAGAIAFAVLSFVPSAESYRAMPLTVLVPGMVLLLLSVLPTNRRLVRGVAGILALLAIGLVANSFAGSVSVAGHLQDTRDPRTMAVYDGFVPSWFVALDLFSVLAQGVVFLATALVLVASFRWPARRQLAQMWRAISICCIAFPLFAIPPIAGNLHLGRASRLINGNYFPYIIASIEMFVFGWVMFPIRFRLFAQSWLASRGPAVTTAAAIAALIGGKGSVQHAQEHAIASFRAVSLDQVDFSWLSTNAPDPTLHARTSKVGFGEVDCFVSHSWSDDPHLKWEALQAWRARFVAEHSREPLVWLDRCCINGKNVEDDLRCLPVWLAGCDTLLVILGPSYLHRLWCIIELFAWLQMGGSVERVHVLQLGDVDVQSAVDAFDVHEAQCTQAADQERLLTVIEAGFSGLEAFNVVARKMLAIAFHSQLEEAASQSYAVKYSVALSIALPRRQASHTFLPRGPGAVELAETARDGDEEDGVEEANLERGNSAVKPPEQKPPD